MWRPVAIILDSSPGGVPAYNGAHIPKAAVKDKRQPTHVMVHEEGGYFDKCSLRKIHVSRSTGNRGLFYYGHRSPKKSVEAIVNVVVPGKPRVDYGQVTDDEPWLYPNMAKIFESVVVIPETGEILGSLRWGVAGDQLLGGWLDDCTDLPSHGFDLAMQNYYSMPKGSDPQSPGRCDVIMDGYDFGDYELSDANKKRLDPVITAFLNYPKVWIAVSGFSDAGEHDDPDFTSLMRALLVQRYLMSKGVPQDKIDVHSFGVAWARYPTSPGENRNRRVQIRTYYK